MPNQSGKIVLVLVLLLLILGVVVFSFLPNLKIQGDKDKEQRYSLDSKKETKETNDQLIRDKNSELQNIYTFSKLGIEVNYQQNAEIEEFSAEDFSNVNNIKPEHAYRLYFNENSDLEEEDRVYSGLTMFFISYPIDKKISLDKFLPNIIKDGNNNVDKIEKSKIGSFDGFKHTQCCNSGGVVEYYFLNPDLSNLILVKVYNYGPNRELYDKASSDIIDSIKGIRG